jgi:type II secretory pathway pseudopilin PulG
MTKKCKIKKFKQTKGGYTILETMIAVSLFLVVITSGMGALLNANILHKKSQDMRSIMDNLSFIMEDISRNLRTGSVYHCLTNVNNLNSLTSLVSCPNGGDGIAFEETHGSSIDASDQWVYKIGSGNISKSTTSGSGTNPWVQLNPSEVVITSLSKFSVFGAETRATGDTQQPFVIIKLAGTITYKNVITPFSLQTSVSQRLIDL